MIGHNSFQSIIRSNPETGFTKISNALLQDKRISYETRGLLAELLSRPDDWEITVLSIVKSGPAGRDKVYRMIKEAEKFGHLGVRRDRRDDGTLLKQRYMVSDDPRLLAAALELYRMETGDEPLPEKAEVVIPFPGNPEVVKNGSKQAASWKPGSGHPLPEKPDTAEPLPENPTHTKERYIQTKEVTKARGGENGLGKVAAAVAVALTAAPMPLAAQPHPVEHVMQDVAECWQNPKARYEAGANIHEMRAQRQVWMTPFGVVEVAGDFKAELEREFPLVSLKEGLATAAPNVHIGQGAIRAMQAIRRQFGYSQQNEANKQKRADAWKTKTSSPEKPGEERQKTWQEKQDDAYNYIFRKSRV